MKLFTILFLIIIVAGGVYLVNQYQVEQLTINDLTIPSDSFAYLSDAIGEGNYVLCSIKDDKCIKLNKQIIDNGE